MLICRHILSTSSVIVNSPSDRVISRLQLLCGGTETRPVSVDRRPSSCRVLVCSVELQGSFRSEAPLQEAGLFLQTAQQWINHIASAFQLRFYNRYVTFRILYCIKHIFLLWGFSQVFILDVSNWQKPSFIKLHFPVTVFNNQCRASLKISWI